MMWPDNNKDQNSKGEKDLVLTIRMQTNGAFGVDGPGDGKIYNEPICLWLLELAKDHIKFNNKMAIQSKIIKPDMFNRIKGAFGKK